MGIRINGSSGGYVEIGVPANPSNRNVTLPDTDGEALVGTTNGAVEIPSGTTLQRPTGAAGQIRFNTDTGVVEYWAPELTVPAWTPIRDRGIDPLNVEYLVVGGGGGGSGYSQAASAYYQGNDGSDSVFDTITAGGGGAGGHGNAGTGNPGRPTNGSGGGTAGGPTVRAGGAGDGTGNAGGEGVNSPSYAAGSGGGAGAAGTNAGTGSAQGSSDGGIGVTTTIITAAQATANSVGEVDSGNVYFAGGGASGPYTYHSGTGASGGLGGGGDSETASYASYGATNSGHGTPNTGGGAAGYTNSTYGSAGGGAGGVVTGTINEFPTGQAKSIVVGAGGAPHPTDNTGGGGSGVIILKYNSRYTATFTAGVTQTTITDGSNKISFIKATTNTSQTVTFSQKLL